MEILNNTQVYSLGNDYTDYEVVEMNHIRDTIIARFEMLQPTIKDKHLYSIKLQLKPSRQDYHRFGIEILNEISRRLTNGMSVLGTMSNRKFWNSCFLGSARTISIVEEDFNDYPVFSLNFILYSHIDNLDDRILKQLALRTKMINPSVRLTMNYLGTYTTDLLCSHIDYRTEVNFDNPVLSKLGEKTIDDIYHNQFQRPRFLGGLYKLTPSMI
jgi:hypothetical protein